MHGRWGMRLEALFVELGYRDYLGALQRYRVEHLKDAFQSFYSTGMHNF